MTQSCALCDIIFERVHKAAQYLRRLRQFTAARCRSGKAKTPFPKRRCRVWSAWAAHAPMTFQAMFPIRRKAHLHFRLFWHQHADSGSRQNAHAARSNLDYSLFEAGSISLRAMLSHQARLQSSAQGARVIWECSKAARHLLERIQSFAESHARVQPARGRPNGRTGQR